MEQVSVAAFLALKGTDEYIFRYEYNIEVKVPQTQKGILNLNSREDSKVTIRAENAFGNFTGRINASDRIWFKGILRTSLSPITSDFISRQTENSRRHTRVDLTEIGCLHCADKKLTPVSIKSKLKMENRIKDFRRALKYLLNVLFNPLVTFK